MENPEEILHSLEEFSKMKPKDIPRELEDYLCFVAKTGDPVYQWGTIKSLFKEKLINVITDFYQSCPSMDIPPCPNVEVFNYESMKTFILEKLDTFAAAPFTVQRICELLTTPRKEYNRIDKYMRALEKNILVVSTTEPGNRRATENGDSIVNGLESEHLLESNNDINVEEMDDTPVWSRISPEVVTYQNIELQDQTNTVHTFPTERSGDCGDIGVVDSVITCRPTEGQPYVSIKAIPTDGCMREEGAESDVTVTITAIPAAVQKRRDSIEPVVPSEQVEKVAEPSSNFKEEESSSKVSEVTSTIQETPILETEILHRNLIQIETIVSSETEVSESCETTSDKVELSPEHVHSAEIEPIESNEAQELKTTETIELSQAEETKEAEAEEQVASSSDTPEVCESESVIDVKENSVSSTDDVSNDATDIEHNQVALEQRNLIDPIDDESRSCSSSDIPQEESSTSCPSNLSSDSDEHDKQVSESTQKFEPTRSEIMDVDVNEESCQESPIQE